MSLSSIPPQPGPQVVTVQENTSLQESVDRLNTNLERLEGVPAGSVLTKGFDDEGGVLSFMNSENRTSVAEIAHSVSEV